MSGWFVHFCSFQGSLLDFSSSPPVARRTAGQAMRAGSVLASWPSMATAALSHLAVQASRGSKRELKKTTLNGEYIFINQQTDTNRTGGQHIVLLLHRSAIWAETWTIWASSSFQRSWIPPRPTLNMASLGEVWIFVAQKLPNCVVLRRKHKNCASLCKVI